MQTNRKEAALCASIDRPRQIDSHANQNESEYLS
jgi:hypothetical protein